MLGRCTVLHVSHPEVATSPCHRGRILPFRCLAARLLPPALDDAASSVRTCICMYVCLVAWLQRRTRLRQQTERDLSLRRPFRRAYSIHSCVDENIMRAKETSFQRGPPVSLRQPHVDDHCHQPSRTGSQYLVGRDDPSADSGAKRSAELRAARRTGHSRGKGGLRWLPVVSSGLSSASASPLSEAVGAARRLRLRWSR